MTRLIGILIQMGVLICSVLPFVGLSEKWLYVTEAYAVLIIIAYTVIVPSMVFLNYIVNNKDKIEGYDKGKDNYLKLQNNLKSKTRYFAMFLTFPVITVVLIYSGSVVTSVFLILSYLAFLKVTKSYISKEL